MTPGVIEKIFDMFAQAERTSDRSQGGLGIGMALVKNLVQLHGGRVAAFSEGPGTGSQIDISLPRTSAARGFDKSEIAMPTEQVQDRKLLVVDDNVDAADMLGLLLEQAGYQVQVVHSAAAALEIVANSVVKLTACLLDIGLPDMDGNALATRLRHQPATSEALLIAVTGYGQDGDREKTRAAGFDDHYVKPVNVEQLMQTLATWHPS